MRVHALSLTQELGSSRAGADMHREPLACMEAPLQLRPEHFCMYMT